MAKPLRVEDLLFPKLVELLGQAKEGRLPVDETTVSSSMTPMMRLLLDSRTAALTVFGLFSRGASLFLVDFDEFTQAVVSAGPAPTVELPPLPFSRLVVECSEDYVFPLGNVEDGHFYDMELFTINERLRGECWDVHMLLRKANTYDHPEQSLASCEIHRDGTVVQQGPSRELPLPVAREGRPLDEAAVEKWMKAMEGLDPDELSSPVRHAPDSEKAMGFRTIPLEFAHLVNARGVTTEAVPVPRAQRRRLDRFKISHPSVYFVQIGAASESHPGPGDREYHHRWLVRGHWRHFRRGGRSWVRPYIKGPAGAPWKGRPVYVLPLKETA